MNKETSWNFRTMDSRNIFVSFIICLYLLEVDSRLRIELDQFEILTERLTTVLSNCRNIKQSTIGLLTSSKVAIKWTKESLKSMSLINVNDVENVKTVPKRTNLDQNLNIFLITTPSAYYLKVVVNKLRDTKWWNPSALHVILDDRTVKAGCKNANQFLEIMWKEELLSSIFVCINNQSDYKMFTYNPFISWAPKPWRKVEKNDTKDTKNPWTLLSQTFNYGQTNCDSLDFPKTETLGGHTIKAIGLHIPPSLTMDTSPEGFAKLAGVDGRVVGLLWSKLNVTLQLTRITNSTHYNEFLPLVTNGTFDILLNSQYIFNKLNMSTTYPHLNSGISILTKYPENEATYKKILNFMNPLFMLAVILVCLGTVIFIRVFAQQGIAEASLEVLRMILGNSMVEFPARSAFRIYLITVFLLFMLTSSSFQSNLSSLLTSPSPKLPVDSIDSLKESKFWIYAYHGYKNAIFDDVLFSRVKTVSHWDCSEYVQKIKNIACAADRAKLLRIAFKKNLHLSKHRINTLFSAFVVRPNWPLKNRVSFLLLHLSEGGLIDLWWRKTMDPYVRKWKQRVDSGKKGYEVMKLKDLAFAFYMLILGLGGSSVTFLLEIAAWRLRRIVERKAERSAMFTFLP